MTNKSDWSKNMIYYKNKWWKQLKRLIKTIMSYTRTTDDNYLRFLHDCRLNLERLDCDAVEQGFYDYGMLKHIRNWIWELDVHMDHPVFKTYIEDGNQLLEDIELYRIQIPTWL